VFLPNPFKPQDVFARKSLKPPNIDVSLNIVLFRKLPLLRRSVRVW